MTLIPASLLQQMWLISRNVRQEMRLASPRAQAQEWSVELEESKRHKSENCTCKEVGRQPLEKQTQSLGTVRRVMDVMKTNCNSYSCQKNPAMHK